jgi:hypothetical protein
MLKQFLKQGIFFLLIPASIICLCGCEKSSPQYTAITENDVVTIMNEVERATLAKDLDGIMKYLAPFVVINVSMESPESTFLTQKVQLSKDQYKEELKKTFSKLTRHEYRRENDIITVSNDKRRALVEMDIMEVIVIGGKEMKTTTHEKTVMEIINGTILVTQIDAMVVKRE